MGNNRARRHREDVTPVPRHALHTRRKHPVEINIHPKVGRHAVVGRHAGVGRHAVVGPVFPLQRRHGLVAEAHRPALVALVAGKDGRPRPFPRD